jgi:hypothetical protein
MLAVLRAGDELSSVESELEVFQSFKSKNKTSMREFDSEGNFATLKL